MILYTPECFLPFSCIAQRCSDSCCVGWEISIDTLSLKRYEQTEGPFGDRLRHGILQSSEGARFRLSPNGRCVFLNRQGLCEIYLNLGKDALCEICSKHPRFFEWYGPVEEAGLGLCCEEATRLWFSQTLPLRFYKKEIPGEGTEAPAWYNPLVKVRQTAFSFLQDTSLSFFHRLALMVALCGHVQDCMDRNAPEDIAAVLDFYACPDQVLTALRGAVEFDGNLKTAVLEEFQTLDAMDPGWTDRLRAAHPCSVCTCALVDWPEKVALYLTYRYLLKACFDGDILGRGKWIALSCIVLMFLSADVPDEKGLFVLAKDFSKNVEYCPANLEKLARDMERPCFSAASILGFLLKD